MKIKKFKESGGINDFISLNEVEDIFSHINDMDNVEITISNGYANSSGDICLSEKQEDDDDIRIIKVEIFYNPENYMSYCIDYGSNTLSLSSMDLDKFKKILDEINDCSSHLESNGYSISTNIIGNFILVTIFKEGSMEWEN